MSCPYCLVSLRHSTKNWLLSPQFGGLVHQANYCFICRYHAVSRPSMVMVITTIAIIALLRPSCLLPCLPAPFYQELAFIAPVWWTRPPSFYCLNRCHSMALFKPGVLHTFGPPLLDHQFSVFIYCRAIRRSAYLDSLCAATPAIHASWLHLCMLCLLLYRPSYGLTSLTAFLDPADLPSPSCILLLEIPAICEQVLLAKSVHYPVLFSFSFAFFYFFP